MRDGVIADMSQKRLQGYISEHPRMPKVHSAASNGFWTLTTTSNLLKDWTDLGRYFYETQNTVYWSKEKIPEIKGVHTDLDPKKWYMKLSRCNKCQKETLTFEGDCHVCNLSKTSLNI